MNRTAQAPAPLQSIGKNVLALVVTSALGLTSGMANATQNWSYTYDSNGQMLTSDGPRDNVNDAADITTYTYDTSGNMATVTNALSHLTQLQDYNGRGQPGKVIDANGIETLLTYHVRGWLTTTTVKDPNGNATLDAVTTYGYDNVGQVTSITLPDGVVLNYEYDGAHRLEAIQSSQGERIEYTLDNAGNRTQEVVKGSGGLIKRTQTRVFDELSRLMNDVGAEGQTIHYDYDTNNNVETITDPRTNATDQTFDALNRLKKQIDPDLEEVNYTYDDMDRIKTVTDQRGLVTIYNYDGFGNLTSVVSPDTGTTTYQYDDANNRIKMTDARNVVVDYTYDALNRLATVKYPASPSEDITYTYDDTGNNNYGVGRLTGVTDESGSIAFHYDHRGNITTKTYTIETTNYSIGYSYDLADKITQITYPSGRLVNYSYDVQGRISAITTQEDAQATAVSVVSNVTYLPFGPIQSYTYGNGMTHTVSHDQDYRVTDIESTGTATALDLFYDYDPNSNITVLNDEANTSYNQTFDYDKLNRLKDADGNYGSLDYQYDGVGNRTQKTTTQGTATTTETYSYDTNSNQLNQVDSDDGATQTQRQFQYDDNGNLIKDTRPDGNVLDLTYNDANRYAALDKNTTPTAAYMYNALGQRTAKVSTDPVISAHYHYDETGLLLASSASDGAVRTEYIYLGMEKVAVLVTSPSNTPPQLTITAPVNNSNYVQGTSITLTGTATDAEDGNLGASIQWSSNLNGALGSGASVTTNALTTIGSHIITASVTDSADSTSTVTITVIMTPPPNNLPSAVDDTETTQQDMAVTSNVLTNDSDPDGDSLSITAVTQASNGSVTYTANDVTYTPTANYVGSDSFTYTISDGQGGSDTATVTVTVTPPPNTVPEAVDDTVTTQQDTAVTSSVLTNDSDPDGDSLSITAVTQASNGSVTYTANDVTYTPTANYIGSDSFTYTISDGQGGNATATVTITVIASPQSTNVFRDDFETDKGWTINPNNSDTATIGQWERAIAEPTSNSGAPVQLAGPSGNTRVLVTGALSGSSYGTYDIDGGKTSIRSPSITLPTLAVGEQLKLHVTYNFAHNNNNGSADDYLRLTLEGNTQTVLLAEQGGAGGRPGLWQSYTATIDSYAGQVINLFIEAADGAGGTVVEAQIADISIDVVSPVSNVFHDDFETDQNWTINPNSTDTATTGQWERGDPEGTYISAATGLMQLATTTSDQQSLVTGRLAGSSAGAHDIDGGMTSIRSPDIVLPPLAAGEQLELTLNYSFAHNTNSSVDDIFRITLIGTTNTVLYEALGSAVNRAGGWHKLTANLDAHAGETVHLLIEASDSAAGSIQEAQVDDVIIIKVAN